MPVRRWKEVRKKEYSANVKRQSKFKSRFLIVQFFMGLYDIQLFWKTDCVQRFTEVRPENLCRIIKLPKFYFRMFVRHNCLNCRNDKLNFCIKVLLVR